MVFFGSNTLSNVLSSICQIISLNISFFVHKWMIHRDVQSLMLADIWVIYSNCSTFWTLVLPSPCWIFENHTGKLFWYIRPNLDNICQPSVFQNEESFQRKLESRNRDYFICQGHCIHLWEYSSFSIVYFLRL